jgi:hypothetical protein
MEKNKEARERSEDATDSRTLDEIEEELEETSRRDSPAPSPDEGSGRTSDDDAGRPM